MVEFNMGIFCSSCRPPSKMNVAIISRYVQNVSVEGLKLKLIKEQMYSLDSDPAHHFMRCVARKVCRL